MQEITNNFQMGEYETLEIKSPFREGKLDTLEKNNSFKLVIYFS